jgi:hypothetical protein
MGGIGTLPMDFGQPLQVPQQQQPSFSSAQNITMNPLLNYGQPQLGQAGGTPLTMAGGGITRLGYEEGGMGMMQDQAMMQPEMQQAPEGIMNAMPQQMMEPPLQGMEGQQPDIKDPRQALEIIIQMLIAQGIPPEQAREIAMQMIQAVAEGGMQEMSDERVEARFGGSINNGRENYGFGSFFSGIGKAVSSVAKGVTSAVKSVVKSDLGKAALAAAAVYFGGPMLAGALEGTSAGSALFGAADLIGGTQTFSPGLLGFGGSFAPMSGSLLSPIASMLPSGTSGILSSLGGNMLGSLAGGVLGGTLSGGAPQKQPGELDADYQNRVNQYKAQYAPLLNPTIQYPNNPFYPQKAANGGRIGYQEGGIGDLVSQITKQEFFGNNMLAAGGVPTRENQAGVTELDYREKGGFVPPIGIKEKADDIPAMLSNNEFVFTADAVRNAGNGSVNKGAERMYGLMKQLEAGGMA